MPTQIVTAQIANGAVTTAKLSLDASLAPTVNNSLSFGSSSSLWASVYQAKSYFASGSNDYLSMSAAAGTASGTLYWGSKAVVTQDNIGSYGITGVTAGNGLTGGGSSGAVTLNVGTGTGITVNADDVAVNQGYAFSWTAQHTFNPGSAAAPFLLGANATGQLVTGLNADLLDGQHGSYYQNPANLTSAVSVSKGGTALTSTPTNGQLLVGNGSGYTLATLSATGLTVTNGAGSIGLSVNYGSGANQAVQGNTGITISAGTNLTGGGSITLGAGGTVTLNVSSSPSFSGQITSTVAGGTAPFVITSTTVVTNLNADLLDGQHGSYYQNASNLNAGNLAYARMPTGAGTWAPGGTVTLSSQLSLTSGLVVTGSSTFVSGKIQVVPSNSAIPTADTTGNRLDVGQYFSFVTYPYPELLFNAFYNGTAAAFQYSTTGQAYQLYQNNATGDLMLKFCQSGTAGQTLTSSTYLQFNSTGLGINTAPSYTLHVGGDVGFTGTLQAGTVPWARLSGHPTVSAGNGLSGGGALTGNVTLSVSYGTAANTAVQGNTSITVSAGTNLTGGGSLTLGAGGTLTLNVSNSPSFSGQITSTYNSGAPFVIASTTLVSNLNADLLDGNHASAFLFLSTAVSQTVTYTATGAQTILKMAANAQSAPFVIQDSTGAVIFGVSTAGVIATGTIPWGSVTGQPNIVNTAAAGNGITISGSGSGPYYGAITIGVSYAGSSGDYGSANTVARSDHLHDGRYFTETELSSSGGGGQVHYNNVTNKPAIRSLQKYVSAGVASGSAITIPGGLTYSVGTDQLAVYVNGIRQTKSTSGTGHDYDFWEASTSTIWFEYDLPSGSIVLFEVIKL